MELVRERELRETLERQLSIEQKNRGKSHHTETESADFFKEIFLVGNYFTSV